MWVVGAQSETVLRIPDGASEPDLTVDVPGVPLRTTAAYGSVWVTSFHGKKVLRLDPATGEVVASIKTGAGPEGVTAGFDSIWVVAQDAGKLLRIDPATNAVSAEIKLEIGARLVEAGPDAMYVAHYADDLVLRVDPETNAVTPVRGRLRRTAGDGGARREGLGHLHALPRAGRPRRHHAARSSRRCRSRAHPTRSRPAPTGGSWWSPRRGRRLVVVDPATAAVSRASTVLGDEQALDDRANLDLVLVGDEAWVSSFNADRVYHLPLPG